MAIKTSDEELMLSFQQGDSKAYEELVRRHKAGVYNFALRFLNNSETAEEVFQEVFIKIFPASANYSPNGKFTTWLYTIARNQCVDVFRRQKLREALSLDAKHSDEEPSLGEMIAGDTIPADILSSAREIETALNLALQKLNIDQREVFLLREKEGLKFEEIAQMTGASVNTVKSRMRYALESLHKVLKKSQFREILEEYEHENR